MNPEIQVDDNGVKLYDLIGQIEFKNVSFVYPNRKETVSFTSTLLSHLYQPDGSYNIS